MPRTSRSLLLAASATALLLSACGGGASADGAVADLPDDALVVTGTDTLEFEPETLAAAAGEITIALRCEGGVNHNLVVEVTDDSEELVAECARGRTEVGSIDLDPGTYTYVCTVPGHESRMRGTLTVG